MEESSSDHVTVGAGDQPDSTGSDANVASRKGNAVEAAWGIHWCALCSEGFKDKSVHVCG